MIYKRKTTLNGGLIRSTLLYFKRLTNEHICVLHQNKMSEVFVCMHTHTFCFIHDSPPIIGPEILKRGLLLYMA